MTSVRVLAARVLQVVDSGRATLGSEVDRARRGVTDERDRALLLELTTGVYRWRAALDACLQACTPRPVSEIDPAVVATLRLAIYQLRYLDRIPPHAVVHESVEAARELGSPHAAGFVNGVLRGYLRAQATITLPARPAPDATRRQRLAYLSITLSHPKWLVARWLDRYGFEETERWCLFNNASPDITVRGRAPHVDAVTLLQDANISATRGAFAPEVARLAPGTLGSLSADLRRELVVQDEGSVLVAHVADAHPGERVLDLCAAPGGKTAVMWSDMNSHGCLVASDIRPSRVRVLRETLTDAQVPHRIVTLDASRPLPFDAVFDRVMVDVPCSGLGTLRRDPDVRWAVTLESLPELVGTQRRILAEAARVVRPGGTLVYATCSSEPDENDEVVEAFLADSASFTERPLSGPGTDTRGRLRTMPPRDRLDAFFAARLVRCVDA
ncbi:MAG: 16S rRNA (cytosine(967)-C(5))-methyltransferase RsmB [Acidobacteria bacterium]|nr:16S rRNA (cytosine(967)-C(5))-methyltransferase RsmB [Acidobacteriota bacterium]